MKNKFFKGIAAAMVLLVSGTSTAGLINMGSGMVYDDELDVTWLLDANYMETSGFDADGIATYAQVSSWASNLVYGGYDDWRLPTVTPINGNSFNISFSFDGTTDRGFNNDSTASELGHMFYNNLNNISFYAEGGTGPQPGSESFNSSFIDANSGIEYMFENIGLTYWANPANNPFQSAAWAFNFRTFTGLSTGEQQIHSINSSLSGWAVRDGMVSNTLNVNNPPPPPSTDVPEPSTLAVFVLGLFGLAARKYKNKI